VALSKRTTKVPGKAAATPRGGVPRPATPKPAVRQTPAPAPAHEEPILEALPEPVAPAEQTTPSGSRQAAARTPVGSRKSTASIKPYSGGSEEGDEPRGAARKARGGREGAEIGNLQRRGMSLGLKISIFTLLVIGMVTSLFGYVSIRAMRESLMNEIKRSGYNSIMALQPFGQRVIADFKGQRNESTFQSLLAEYKKNNAADLEYIQRIVKSDPRIQDVAIFASPSAVTDPSTDVVRAKDSKHFEPSKVSEQVDGLDSFDQSVRIYWARYGDRNCLWFRIPLEAAGPDKAYSTAVLILSAAEIESQVQGVFRNLVIAGVLFVATGLLMSLWLASLISRPVNVLVSDVNTVAEGDLDHESTVPTMTKDEIGLLAMAFNRMTRSLRDAREKEREAQRLAGEVNTAKAIHAQLIPSKRPDLPGIDIYTEYNCAKEVGGDYYDFIPVGDTEHLALCVADVSGKGIPGSMVMGTTRTYLRMMAVNNFSPASVLSKTNFYVAREIKRGMFVTCVYAILNLRTREMTVASAGHNPMLIWRAATKTIEKVRPNGIALGFDKGPIFDKTVREEKVKLNVGDRVVMYTDGVVESMNEQREEWSDEALDAFTLQHAQQTSKDYVRLLKKALEEHQGKAEQHDDITIVTFRVTPVAGTGGTAVRAS